MSIAICYHEIPFRCDCGRTLTVFKTFVRADGFILFECICICGAEETIERNLQLLCLWAYEVDRLPKTKEERVDELLRSFDPPAAQKPN
jgi:hypothetical protein